MGLGRCFFMVHIKRKYLVLIIFTILSVFCFGAVTEMMAQETSSSDVAADVFTDQYIDLHLHLDGAISLDIAKKLAEIQDLELPADSDAELTELLTVPEDCESLNDFLECFKLPLSLMQTPKGLSEAVRLVCDNIKNQGVIYAEIRWAPQLHTDQGMTQEDAIQAALDGLKRTDLKANLILCCMRGEGNEAKNEETLRLARKYLVEDGGVVALDLAGAEALYPTENYRELFAEAKEANIPFTIHAGEAAGADSVKLALEYGVKRIGHGVRSYEDPEVLELLKETGATLEMCPTSNRQTHAIENMEDYPLIDYMNQGIRVTLNTDDMGIEGITLADEYRYMREEFGLTPEQENTLLNNAIDAAFTTEEVKEGLREQLGLGYSYQDVVVLATTDMHGKCWETNILTGEAQKPNMLRVSTAVSSIREEYGPENVILVDNGDLFQGTLVSEMSLRKSNGEQSDFEETLPMALCLKEIGYDAFVLGNHEFNYNWKVMRKTYDYLEANGIPVLAANVYYDGSDGAHEAGENAFTPYITREIFVNGHPHKIGILGFENVDITRWDLPANYPGLMFASPDNKNYSIAFEAAKYLPKMREEGCEFIILSYHSGLGGDDGDLAFGVNTDNQGLRLIGETEGLGLVILGHDHSGAYSGSSYVDASGHLVPVVNGGGQELAKTVFRFSENVDGELVWELQSSENLHLDQFDVDEALQEKVRLYAERAMGEIEKPIGYASGDWDQSTDFYTSQTDTIDLVHLAQMSVPSKLLAETYGGNRAAGAVAAEEKAGTDREAGTEERNVTEDEAGVEDAAVAAGTDAAEKLGIDGLDHLDVDLSMTTDLVSDNYVVKPGGISLKDIYRLYRFSNKLLVLPLSGREIRAIMEENAASHLNARVYGGKVHYFSNGSNSTHMLFGGMNFTYDMAQPVGERVKIESFWNGRPFEEDRIYLAAVNNYLLGNDGCGLRDYREEDAIWEQTEDQDDGEITDLIAQYVEECCADGGELTPDLITWNWSVDYSADMDHLPAWEGELAAKQAAYPEEGHAYILYHEASGNALTGKTVKGGLGGAACGAYGDALTAPLAADVLTFTVQAQEDGSLLIQTSEGQYLTCGSDGQLRLTEEPGEDGQSLWELRPADGGWYLVHVNSARDAAVPQAIEYYSDRFTTYGFGENEGFLFNFYEVL